MSPSPKKEKIVPETAPSVGLLMDIQTRETNGKMVIDLYVRLPSSETRVLTDTQFPPYFYIKCVSSATPSTIARELEEETFSGGIKPHSVVVVKKEKQPYLQLFFNRISDLMHVRESILRYPFVESLYEANIPYTKRYLLDKQLVPYYSIQWALRPDGTLESVSPVPLNEETETAPHFRTGAFDIETYTSSLAAKFPTPSTADIISISAVSPAGEKVWMIGDYHDAHTFPVPDENGLLSAFQNFITLSELDIVYTYNGDRFDFPFVVEKSQTAKKPLDFGTGPVQLITRAGEKNARINGLQHLDVFQVVKLLSRFQYLKTPRMDLESVMRAVFNEGEKTLSHKEIWKTWKTKKGLDKLSLYNLTDSRYTQRLGDAFLPIILELSRLVHSTLYDISRSTASQLVETLLMHESAVHQKIIPNSPTDDQVRGRMNHPIEGGYVKEPTAGLHNHLAVLDFRSLHPSIMISHNISPETIDCEHPSCKKGKNRAPTEHWFCEKERGLFTNVLEKILDARIAVQGQMDLLEKGDPRLTILKARKQALKIVLNSFFGTLAYPRFRWYSRESARAITAWSRHYIRQTLQHAEKEGYVPVYGDTDSAFILVPENKTEDDVRGFVKKVNHTLPGRMELEFEGLYRRGIFVTKKEGRAAKKRYALADYDNTLTIVGFEYVRRDHSLIARETQKKVLHEILINGDPDAAMRAVQETIALLRAGKVTKKELVVLTLLQRKIESYAVISPHVAAATKAMKRGKEITTGQLLGYIITNKGKTISDKAELEEFVKEGDYDAEYYIKNQVLPAVEKIFVELGYSLADLERGGKQTGLGAFV